MVEANTQGRLSTTPTAQITAISREPRQQAQRFRDHNHQHFGEYKLLKVAPCSLPPFEIPREKSVRIVFIGGGYAALR